MTAASVGSPFPPRTHIGSLPLEIIEEILIFSTAAGAPTAAAAFAQTCRYFHDCIYRSLHSHLWRQMFLAIFDDARPAKDILRYGRFPTFEERSHSPRDIDSKHKGKQVARPCDDFPWEHYYKQRTWTANYLSRHAPNQSSADSSPPTSADLCKALECLLDLIQTAAPMPSSSFDNLPVPTHTHPLFPPLSVASTCQPKMFSQSRNIIWLSSVLSVGFPKALTSRLSMFKEDGTFGPTCDPLPEDQLFYKLLCQTGLLESLSGPAACVPQSLMSALVVPQDLEVDSHSEDSSYSDADSQSETGTSSTGGEGGESSTSECSQLHQVSAGAQDEELAGENELTARNDSFRRLARIRVYNMHYLRRERLFGPFNMTQDDPPASCRPFSPPSNSSASQSAVGPSKLSAELDVELDEDDVADPDYVDSDLASAGSTSIEVASSRLFFDWVWLGAARQVVEGNLRDLLMGGHRNVLRALLSLEGLRACSAPGFPNDMPSAELQTITDLGEWDWAGVEGQWRRCVCWLDYRDLVANNVQGVRNRFDDPNLCEVMRIIPLTLRIQSYSAAPPEWPGRPTINVVGELAGPSNNLSDALKLHGKVEMIGNGDIRWSLCSIREDGGGEWQSEGVQLGGLGSATGIIGMWTGAEHEHMDPLGPFWAWKVGQTDISVEGKALQLRGSAK